MSMSYLQRASGSILDPAKIALLVDGLNGAASRGSAAAHYALTLTYRGDDLSEEEGRQKGEEEHR